MLRTRVAELSDLEAIVDIYNQAVAGQATAYLEPLTVENRREWFARHPPGTNPILVAELDAKVVGWASLSEYRPGRRAVRHTAEISYFVHFDHHRQGVGSELLRAAIELCPAIEIKTLLAILLEDNAASIGLLRRFEFEHWGTLPGVADFDGREVGHLYFGRRVC
jgi:phosphinothricin acetyltransferase